MKATEQIKSDLLYLRNLMPKNYLETIEKKIGGKYKASYISEYFTAKYHLSLENQCIMDAALEILHEEDLKVESFRNKYKKFIKA